MRDNPFKYINHNPNNDVYEKTSTKGSPQNTSKSTNLDCFKILGFSEIPTEEELKKQFRLLAKENHPDRGGNPEIFEKITQAYAEASNIIKTINTTK